MDEGSRRQVNGEHDAPLDTALVDSELRLAMPPFDGAADLATWLSLPDPSAKASAATINIRISPPVDLILPQSTLSKNRLSLIFEAHTHRGTQLPAAAICSGSIGTGKAPSFITRLG